MIIISYKKTGISCRRVSRAVFHLHFVVFSNWKAHGNFPAHFARHGFFAFAIVLNESPKVPRRASRAVLIYNPFAFPIRNAQESAGALRAPYFIRICMYSIGKRPDLPGALRAPHFISISFVIPGNHLKVSPARFARRISISVCFALQLESAGR